MYCRDRLGNTFCTRPRMSADFKPTFVQSLLVCFFLDFQLRIHSHLMSGWWYCRDLSGPPLLSHRYFKNASSILTRIQTRWRPSWDVQRRRECCHRECAWRFFPWLFHLKYSNSTPSAAAFFSTYETMKKLLPFSGNLAPVNHMISASVAEVVRSLHLFGLRYDFHGCLGWFQAACLIRVPTEVIKTRMQTSTYGASGSSLSAARLVLSTVGLSGFYRGFGITVMREVIQVHPNTNDLMLTISNSFCRSHLRRFSSHCMNCSNSISPGRLTESLCLLMKLQYAGV